MAVRKVILLTCNWNAYSGLETAGVERLSYPAGVFPVKVGCLGQVSTGTILKAFENGADGVFIAGCMEGECHFLEGNLRAKKRVNYAKRLLDEVGIGGGRLEMYHMSAGEGGKFVAAVEEMTERIRSLGPSPIKRGTRL